MAKPSFAIWSSSSTLRCRKSITSPELCQKVYPFCLWSICPTSAFNYCFSLALQVNLLVVFCMAEFRGYWWTPDGKGEEETEQIERESDQKLVV